MAIVPAVSGTYDFGLSGLDFSLEALERCGIRGQAITPDHMVSLRRSANLVQVMASNRGVNLWKVDLIEVPLAEGVATYGIPASTVMMLDVYLRNYMMQGAGNFTPQFSTANGSSVVTIGWPNHGTSAGQFASVVIPISVGGLLVYGFYQVNTVPNANSITVIAAALATANVTNGGTVPTFTTAGGSASVTVNLANHGYVIGDDFVVQVQAEVGGITLSGSYPVANVPSSDSFTITSSYVAGFTQTVTENGGQCQLSAQVQNAQPFDRIMTPISRNDYAALPNKQQQAPPTQYWFDRQAFNPTATLYPVPDQNGPYSMFYYRVAQMFDAEITATSKPDMPYRFLEWFCAETAAHMAVKWAPERLDKLMALAGQRWIEAGGEDRERVSWYLQPDFSGYYQ